MDEGNELAFEWDAHPGGQRVQLLAGDMPGRRPLGQARRDNEVCVAPGEVTP